MALLRQANRTIEAFHDALCQREARRRAIAEALGVPHAMVTKQVRAHHESALIHAHVSHG